MPLEQANNIAQLDENWPNGNDTVDRGDDHIRMLKNVLKKTFPGPSGQGFTKPITVDPDVLNNLAATIKGLSDKITNIHTVGAVIFRDDTVNPATIYPGTTWALLSADAAIGFATLANVGTTTGVNDPVVPLPSHTHSITIDGVDNHTHSGIVSLGGFSFEHDQRNNRMPGERWQNGTGAAGAHTHTATIGAAGTAGATLNVRGARRLICAWKRVK